MITADVSQHSAPAKPPVYFLKWHIFAAAGVLLLLMVLLFLPDESSVGGQYDFDDNPGFESDPVIQTPGFKITFMDARGNPLNVQSDAAEASNPTQRQPVEQAPFEIDMGYGETLKPFSVQKESEPAVAVSETQAPKTEPVKLEPVAQREIPAPPPKPTPKRVVSGLALDPLAAHEDWLMSLSPKAYTLQLLAGRNEQAIQSFLAEHQRLGDLAYFRTQRGGQDWFVVVQGNYDTVQQAETAVARLPEQIRNSQPWVRPIGGIQSVIR